MSETSINLKEQDDLDFNTTDLRVFHVIMKSAHLSDPIFLKDGIERYINVSYTQTIEDWYNYDQKAGISAYKYIYYDAE